MHTSSLAILQNSLAPPKSGVILLACISWRLLHFWPGSPLTSPLSCTYPTLWHACCIRWSVEPVLNPVAVEEGISAEELSAEREVAKPLISVGEAGELQPVGTMQPLDAVRLCAQEVSEQLELLAGGLIDKGGRGSVKVGVNFMKAHAECHSVDLQEHQMCSCSHHVSFVFLGLTLSCHSHSPWGATPPPHISPCPWSLLCRCHRLCIQVSLGSQIWATGHFGSQGVCAWLHWGPVPIFKLFQ